MEKQVNNTETLKLQQTLRRMLDEIGWDIKKLAFEFSLHDEFGDRQDLEPDKEYEKIRKALQRKTTKPETLHRYINFVIENNKNRRLYKIPILPNKDFNEKEINFFNEIGAIAQQVFDNETRNV